MRETFRTKYEPRKRVITVSGSAEKDEFIGRYDKHGRVELVPNGKTNVYEFIQSFKDSVDINVLLAKYKNGDTEALSRVQGMYADISDLPKTFADMLNKVKAGEDAFASLPAETRALFNNSVSEWFASVGSADWFDKMGMEAPEPPTPKKKKTSKTAEPAVNDLTKPVVQVAQNGGENE